MHDDPTLASLRLSQRLTRRRLLVTLPALSAALGILSACGSSSAPVAKSQGEQTAPKPAEAKPADAKPAAPPPAAAAAANPAGGTKKWPSPPPMTIDQNKSYKATIETSLGDMTAELFPKDAPNTVNNFIFLAKQGFYDGVIFHRIISSFMVQTGDPTGTGGGDPGYKFNDELPKTQGYTKGTLAMANAGPNTQGSQFFICHGARAESLPKNYTIFGRLTDGMDVLDKIAGVPVRASRSGENSSPVDPPKITTVQVADA